MEHYFHPSKMQRKYSPLRKPIGITRSPNDQCPGPSFEERARYTFPECLSYKEDPLRRHMRSIFRIERTYAAQHRQGIFQHNHLQTFIQVANLYPNKISLTRETWYGSVVADCATDVRKASQGFSNSWRWPACPFSCVRQFEWSESRQIHCNLQSSSWTLGHKAEIDCLQHPFPISETLDNLYRVAATYGLIPTSVSTLAIMADKKSTIYWITPMCFMLALLID